MPRSPVPAGDYELVFLLGLSYQLFIEEFSRRVAAAGYADLRPVHGYVFQALAADGATGSEVAERLGITKQAAGQMLDELEHRGYVRRQDHPRGGRRRLVVLTERGREHLRAAGAILRQLEAEWAAELGTGRMARLRGDLATLVATASGGVIPALRPIW